MSIASAVIHHALISTANRVCVLALLIMLLSGSALADSATDASTPAGQAPGAPVGSFALSGFDNVNLFNGHLNFRLPLLQVGGRGAAAYTITLPIEQRWMVDHNNELGTHYPTYFWWRGLDPGYGPGVLQGRQLSEGCPQWGQYTTGTTRLTFTASDGTEYELRDQIHGGKNASSFCRSDPPNGMASRGTVFVTADGTSATFVSDATIYDSAQTGSNPIMIYPSGFLLLRDGTRYRIDDGTVTWMRDRNGNRLTFAYIGSYPERKISSVTDSMERQVTFEYNVADPQYGTCDRIHFSGFGGAARTIRIQYKNLEEALFPGEFLKTYGGTNGLFPALDGSPTINHNPRIISAVYLPDQRSYQFRYNSYSELGRVDLPTGGAIEYGWRPTVHRLYEIDRRLMEKRVYTAAGILGGVTTFGTYESVEGGSEGSVWLKHHNTDANRTVLAQSKHYFIGAPFNYLGRGSFDLTDMLEGREKQTDILDAQGTLLRRTTNTWGYGGTLAGTSINPRVVETVTLLADTNQVTKRSAINPYDGTIGFDQYNNPTDKWEYGYGVGVPGVLMRHTHIDYLTTNPVNDIDYTSHTGAHLRSLPRAQQVYSVNPTDGTETLVAKSETRYDEYALLNCDGTGCGGTVQWMDPGAVRGNATTARNWLDTNDTWLEIRVEYDQLGNVRKTWDARTDKTEAERVDEIKYSATYKHAYPTHTKSAVPDLTNARATNSSLELSTSYDFSTGKVTSITDANNKTTNRRYTDDNSVADPLERLLRVEYPDGGVTKYNYSDTPGNIYIQTISYMGANQTDPVKSRHYFDGLGRPVRAFLYDGTASTPWSVTDTYYDAMGRVSDGSNAYRVATPNASVPATCAACTTSVYDALGRVATVTTPDGAVLTTSYNGNEVTVTDQAGKKRKSITDGLGRLRQVIEAPDTAACQPDGAGCATTYEYDVLGNLRKVEQGGQLRFFMYDSLGRLIRAKNPEQGNFTSDNDFPALTDATSGTSNNQWSTGYTYDANGNLSKRRDARNITTTHLYDNINRLTVTSYSNGTPSTQHTYDKAPTNGLGRPYSNLESGTAGTTNYVTAYDAMGRPKAGKTEFYSNGALQKTYTYSRNYDLMGHVTSQTYPSGHTVNYDQYDEAGRLKNFRGNLGDGVSRTYSTGVVYDAASRLSSEQFGTATPLYHKKRYNARGQMWDVRLSTINDLENWNRGAIQTWYTAQNQTNGGSGTDNNGNVQMMRTFIPHDDLLSNTSYIEDRYDYDQLNRLTSVAEQSGGSGDIGAQTYIYDRWGNRTLDMDTSCGGGQTLGTRKFVSDLYQIVLERAAEYGGLRAWNKYLREGYAFGQAEILARAKTTAAGFFHSQEYINRNRSDRDYVRDLYRTYLGREPDQGGWDAWTNVAATQGREVALNGLADSSEFANRAATLCPSGMTWGLGNSTAFVADPLTNRLGAPGSPSLMSYDEAGNLTHDAYTGKGARTYDAENRMTSAVSDIYGNSSVYTYDADGRRVRRQTPNATVWQVYGLDGELLAEYAANAASTSPQKEYGYRNGELLITAESASSTSSTSSAPSNLTAAPASAGAQITLDWAEVAGATKYRVERAMVKSGPFTLKATPQTSAYLDEEVTAGKAYLYRVCAADNTGNCISLYGNVALATAYGFADDPLITLADDPSGVTVTRVQALHIKQLREAVNGVRVLAGLGAATWGEEVAAGAAIRAAHVQELRIRLNEALVELSVPVPAYTDAELVTGVTWIKRAHVQELRQGATRGIGAAQQTGGAGGSGSNIQWLVSDHLGTPRMIADLSGSLAGIKRHDYLPFGEEVGAGIGGRTTGLGYSQPSGIRQGFTGYEKDDETGLNFAQARYYSPAMGRFTSPDEPFADQWLHDPQSWNLYTYTRNNPLRYTDPDGRGIFGDLWQRLKNWEYGFRTDEQVQQLEDKWRNYLREQEKAAGGNLINCPLQGQCQKVNIDSLSRNEVLSYAADLKASIRNGTVQYYTPEQVQEIVGATTPAPGLKGDPYHPETVNNRIRPPYKANPAHDPKNPLFNPRKTPEPPDAANVYQNSVRADMGTWYGKGANGKVYRYFSDNAGGVHFSGTVPKAQVPKVIRKQLGL